MSDVLVRKIPPALRRQIKERAKRNGHSLSEEIKLLVQQGLAVASPAPGIGNRLFSLIEDEHRGDDLVFEICGDFPDVPDFQ